MLKENLLSHGSRPNDSGGSLGRKNLGGKPYPTLASEVFLLTNY